MLDKICLIFWHNVILRYCFFFDRHVQFWCWGGQSVWTKYLYRRIWKDKHPYFSSEYFAMDPPAWWVQLKEEFYPNIILLRVNVLTISSLMMVSDRQYNILTVEFVLLQVISILYLFFWLFCVLLNELNAFLLFFNLIGFQLSSLIFIGF